MHLVGNKKILNFLEKSFQAGKVSHAYLFYGPENLGKSLVAEYFASLLLGIKDKENQPSLHQDFVKITPRSDKKNIAIDQIRDLQRSLFTKPLLASFKVAIIEEAEKMTIESANSFLKFLEEPPSHIVLILVVSNLRNIPSTIISRCQLIKFNPIPLSEIEEFLIKEHNFNSQEAKSFARIFFGRLGLGIKFLEKRNFSNFKKEIKKSFSLFKNEFFERLNLISESKDSSLVIWEMLVRDLLLSHYGLSPYLFFCSDEIEKIKQNIQTEKLINFLEN